MAATVVTEGVEIVTGIEVVTGEAIVVAVAIGGEEVVAGVEVTIGAVVVIGVKETGGMVVVTGVVVTVVTVDAGGMVVTEVVVVKLEVKTAEFVVKGGGGCEIGGFFRACASAEAMTEGRRRSTRSIREVIRVSALTPSKRVLVRRETFS